MDSHGWISEPVHYDCIGKLDFTFLYAALRLSLLSMVSSRLYPKGRTSVQKSVLVSGFPVIHSWAYTPLISPASHSTVRLTSSVCGRNLLRTAGASHRSVLFHIWKLFFIMKNIKCGVCNPLLLLAILAVKKTFICL